MFFPKRLTSIQDTYLLGYWHGGKIPVYDVSSMHGLNQIIGHVKYNNSGNGTVLYRGQAHLHEKLIPSILHGNPNKVDLKERNCNLKKYINAIIADEKMNCTLHFDTSLQQRYFYKQVVVESMLQHYGVRTHCQDFVDNHWTALWFGLYELVKEPMLIGKTTASYNQYYYKKRMPQLSTFENYPNSLELLEPTLTSLPESPKLNELPNVDDFDIRNISNTKALHDIMQMADSTRRNVALRMLIVSEINALRRKNKLEQLNWANKIKEIELKNHEAQERYKLNIQSDKAYVYLLLYVADTHGVDFRGVYSGTETITVDLRKALPSILLRPCAQHGWTVRKVGIYSDLSDGVVCVLRLTVELVDKMLGEGNLVSQENFFPPLNKDCGYRILLSREEKAPFGRAQEKYPRDLPSLFPFGTMLHIVNK
jgi:hypothetical protein